MSLAIKSREPAVIVLDQDAFFPVLSVVEFRIWFKTESEGQETRVGEELQFAIDKTNEYLSFLKEEFDVWTAPKSRVYKRAVYYLCAANLYKFHLLQALNSEEELTEAEIVEKFNAVYDESMRDLKKPSLRRHPKSIARMI